ncbi:response regulator [Saccharicrinis sp. FJH54]|uniref:response regulator n=1 Tax=Saccharicrinis sp. FJH54 TaxID=3344665 RepID=UPI0035D4C43C
MKKNVIIVDDHPFILSGLGSLISQFEDLNIIGNASNGKEALKLVKENNVDIVFTDIEMPEMDGNELIDALNSKYPSVKIIVITMHSHQWMVKKLLRKNITAILSKSAGEEDLKKALENMTKEDVYIDSSIKEVIIEALTNEKKTVETETVQLTKREKLVLQLIYEGYSTKEISDKLKKSPNTVETHRKNMFIKCNVKNIAGLIKFGLEKGLIEM